MGIQALGAVNLGLMMKRTLLLLCLAALVLGGCGNLLEPAAAVVNDEKITIDKIEAAVEDFRSMEKFDQLVGQGDVDAVIRQFEQGQLATLVRREVLVPEAAELGIEVTDAEVEEQIDTIKADFPTEGAFEEALAEQAVSVSQLPDLVRDRLLEEALRAEVTKDAGATEEELMAEYEARADEFEETHTAHILVDSQTVAQEISDQLNEAPPGKVEDLFAESGQEGVDGYAVGRAGRRPRLQPRRFIRPRVRGRGRRYGRGRDLRPRAVRVRLPCHPVDRPSNRSVRRGAR